MRRAPAASEIKKGLVGGSNPPPQHTHHTTPPLDYSITSAQQRGKPLNMICTTYHITPTNKKNKKGGARARTHELAHHTDSTTPLPYTNGSDTHGFLLLLSRPLCAALLLRRLKQRRTPTITRSTNGGDGHQRLMRHPWGFHY